MHPTFTHQRALDHGSELRREAAMQRLAAQARAHAAAEASERPMRGLVGWARETLRGSAGVGRQKTELGR